MARLEGTVSLAGLPPHRGLIIHLCFFAVTDADSPPPYNGDPPAEVITDCDTVFRQVDLDKESQETTFAHQFAIERSPGHYYVQLRVILFRVRDGKVFAQLEPFFFALRPLHIAPEPVGHVELPVTWPTEPLEALHHYATLEPQTNRPGTYRVCPLCGSSRFKQVRDEDVKGIPIVRDHICQECGARYTPPVALWQAVVLIACGLVGVVAGALLLYHRFFAAKPPGMVVVNPFYSVLMIAGGGFGLYYGLAVLYRRVAGAQARSEAPGEDREQEG